MGERQSIAQKGVRAIDAENPHLEMIRMLQKSVFALPGCQQTSVNTLLCDTLGLAEQALFVSVLDFALALSLSLSLSHSLSLEQQ